MIALAPLAPIVSKSALALGGGALTKAVTRSLVNGAAFQAGAELVYQIADWARSVDGDWDSFNAEGPTDGCYELDGYGSPYSRTAGGSWQRTSLQGLGDPYIWKWEFISNTPEYRQQRWVYNVNAWLGGSQGNSPNPTNAYVVCATASNESEARACTFKIEPKVGDCKESSTPGSEGPLALPPIQSGDCIINPTFHGFLANPDGTGGVQPVFVMEPSTNLRASGGVIVGGCNFEPTIVVGGGGDGQPPPNTIPSPPDKDPGSDDWWKFLAAGAAAEITGAVLDSLFAKRYPGLIYRMVSVCEKDESGEPISEAVEVPIPDLPAPDAQLARLDAIVELLQAGKNFKQPICNDRPKLEGDWRTISFRSTQSSPYGKSCIRKRFRYRSLSGIGLGALVDHWKDFTWTTGPVIVSHQGYSWGTPQVWAVTADEGKRVIQHAAREAGFDAYQVGEWGISNSASSRYGVSLPVKVDTTGGYYWITARDGSDGRPIVAESPNL